MRDSKEKSLRECYSEEELSKFPLKRKKSGKKTNLTLRVSKIITTSKALQRKGRIIFITRSGQAGIACVIAQIPSSKNQDCFV